MAENRIEFSWKRRPSEIRGYERAMYTTLNNGDYIRVDYNVSEKRVRLYVEVSEENNASYYSILNSGKIVSERNSSGKTARVGEKISERSDEFSTLPNTEVLKLINRAYGIESSDDAESRKKEQQKKEQLSSVRKRYFRETEKAENIYADNSVTITRVTGKIGLIDLIDVMTGIAVSGIFYILNQYSFLALGATAVVWGILLGLFDIVLRNREPVFIKILFFLMSGTAFYIYEYFYL
ncbi:MAG TPA: hypothetical protein P5120_02440 [Spirochaetota bacterium]|nr:hypothetical protein [Spirochaetota bacterium]HPF06004.1 hypothetical protein [Spirochaetota bacterium]HPJ41846.1 hypothetical protein [Spirochaetota bacterium]HPR36813.1 hypothetical protein [Spirochaetota bacterium]HRX46352.1 hypothetical protein [Spirochaetota bacterium]